MTTLLTRLSARTSINFLSELNLAIVNTKHNSAPGLDQIDYTIISSLPPEFHIRILLQIYNHIFDEGSFPIQWKQSLVVLISKAGNAGVRPISLLPCSLKIM